MLSKTAVARQWRQTVRAPQGPGASEKSRRASRRREQAMDFGSISRRHLLQGSAALALGSTIGARAAFAAETTIGFIYVGSRDD